MNNGNIEFLERRYICITGKSELNNKNKCYGLVLLLSTAQCNEENGKITNIRTQFQFFSSFVVFGNEKICTKKEMNLFSLLHIENRTLLCFNPHFLLDFIQKFAINFLPFLLIPSFSFCLAVYYAAFKFGLWRKANCNRLYTIYIYLKDREKI